MIYDFQIWLAWQENTMRQIYKNYGSEMFRTKSEALVQQNIDTKWSRTRLTIHMSQLHPILSEHSTGDLALPGAIGCRRN